MQSLSPVDLWETLSYLDLSFHCDGEEDDEVDNEDGPEDGNVERVKERTNGCYDDGLHCTVPVNQHQHNCHTVFCLGRFQRAGRPAAF